MVVGYLSCLWEAIHIFVNLRVQPSVVTELMEVILLPYVLRYQVCLEADVFRLWEGVVYIKVFNIYACSLRSWCGYDVVDETLDRDQVCYLCGNIAMEVDSVASHCASHLVWVSLLLSIICHYANVRRSFVSRDLIPVNEHARVGATNGMIGVCGAAVSIEQMTDFFAHG